MSDIDDPETLRTPCMMTPEEAWRVKNDALFLLGVANRALGLPNSDCTRSKLSPAAGDPQLHYLREAQYALDSAQTAIGEAQQIARGRGRK